MKTIPRKPTPATTHPEKTPVQKAVAEILKNTNVYPPSALIEAPKAEVEAALKAAWEELERKQRFGPNAYLNAGRPKPTVVISTVGQTIPAGMVQSVVQAATLEKQLEDSLWRLASVHTPVFSREALYKHVGPGHMTDDWYVKKVLPTEVLLLCRCKYILVLQRCRFVYAGQQCEEPAFPREATAKRDTRCTAHIGSQKGTT